jgi:hypothetical protein
MSVVDRRLVKLANSLKTKFIAKAGRVPEVDKAPGHRRWVISKSDGLRMGYLISVGWVLSMATAAQTQGISNARDGNGKPSRPRCSYANLSGDGNGEQFRERSDAASEPDDRSPIAGIQVRSARRLRRMPTSQFDIAFLTDTAAGQSAGRNAEISRFSDQLCAAIAKCEPPLPEEKNE